MQLKLVGLIPRIVLGILIFLQGISIAWAYCCCGYSGLPINGNSPKECTCDNQPVTSIDPFQNICISKHDNNACQIYLINSEQQPVPIPESFSKNFISPRHSLHPAAVKQPAGAGITSNYPTNQISHPAILDQTQSQPYLCVFLC